ncbi:MAG: hypothetical protein ACTSP4_01425 [Candidatus Hodarchaeales archaeon]
MRRDPVFGGIFPGQCPVYEMKLPHHKTVLSSCISTPIFITRVSPVELTNHIYFSMNV